MFHRLIVLGSDLALDRSAAMRFSWHCQLHGMLWCPVHCTCWAVHVGAPRALSQDLPQLGSVVLGAVQPKVHSQQVLRLGVLSNQWEGHSCYVDLLVGSHKAQPALLRTRPISNARDSSPRVKTPLDGAVIIPLKSASATSKQPAMAQAVQNSHQSCRLSSHEGRSATLFAPSRTAKPVCQLSRAVGIEHNT